MPVLKRNYFRMQVPKTTDTGDRDRFFGQMYSDPGQPAVPDDGNWERISMEQTGQARAVEPPPEILPQVALLERTARANLEHGVNQLPAAGANYYGKPYFLEARILAQRGSSHSGCRTPTKGPTSRFRSTSRFPMAKR